MPEILKIRWLVRVVAWGFVLVACAGWSHAAATGGAGAALRAAEFDLMDHRQPVASLDGLWRFHPGDDPAGARGWADPAFDDSSWQLLRSDASWSEQGFPAMSGYAWYRFTVRIPDASKPVSLLLTRIYTSYEVFSDGRTIGRIGEMGATIAPRAIFQFHMFPLTQAAGAAGGKAAGPATVHVAIRVWHSKIWASYLGGGTSRDGNLVGDTRLIYRELEHHRVASKVIFEDAYLYAVIATMVGLAILGLFYYRPKEFEYLWFAVLLLSSAADQAMQVIYNVYSLLPVPIFDLLDGMLVAVNQAAALKFFSTVLGVRRGRAWRVSLGLAFVSPFMAVLYWPGWLSVAAGAGLSWLCLLPSTLWIVVVLVKRARQRDADALLLLIPTGLYFGFFFLFNLALAMSQAGLLAMPDLLLDPLPLPPFTMHWQILVDLVFLGALLTFLIRRFSRSRQGEERYAGQLEAARQVQKILVPEAIAEVAGFAVDCVYHPAEEVGGDFFQILPTADRGLLIVVGDVAGKGLPAAMMVSVLVGAIRAEAAHTSDPAVILSSLNERMSGRSQGFTTCLCLYLAADGVATMVSAGHLAPYHNGCEVELPGALPLGILSPAVYESRSLRLSPGDRLTMVSDGVIEAQSSRGELFGFERTVEISGLPAIEIAQRASRFGQLDDITVVTVGFHGSQNAVQGVGVGESVALL